MFNDLFMDKTNIEEPETEAVTFDDNEKEEYDLSEKIKINNILRADLTSYTNGLQVESVINSLVTGYYIIPKFQRKYIWKRSQVANLALSLIKDVPIPPIYLYLNERKKQVILDGQQRVTSLFLYFNDLWYVGVEEYRRLDFYKINELSQALKAEEAELIKIEKDKTTPKKKLLEKRKTVKANIKRITAELREHGLARSKFYVKDGEEEKDISFSSFTDDEREFLKRKRIDTTIVECRSNNAPKVYADIFKLLNSGGKLLSAQEVRNGVYWELELYDGLFEANKNRQWREIYGKESEVSKDVEILLKILALNYFTKLENNSISIAYSGTFNWSNIMEDYSDESARWNSEKVAEQIKLLTDFLEKIENIDRKKFTCNKAVFEAAFVAYTKLQCLGTIEYEWLCGLGEETEFQKGNVLSNKKSVEDRLTKALKLIKEKYVV